MTTIEQLDNAIKKLDECWGHHQDGSDLLVTHSELFNVVFNVAIKAMEMARDEMKTKQSIFKTYDGLGCPLCGNPFCKGGCFK